jgi:exoribonuclease R
MASKGELIEFKPGTFGIQAPNNIGIFVQSRKTKKGVIVTIYTIRGQQETKSQNILKKSFGEFVQLQNNMLPPDKELKVRLEGWIKQLSQMDAEEKTIAERMGELTERSLWEKTVDLLSQGSPLDFAKKWYDVEEVSRNRLKKIEDLLQAGKSPGVGYFELVSTRPQVWKPITREEKKKVGAEISRLGTIRNKMFEFLEVPILDEEGEETEETETIRSPVAFEELDFTIEENELFGKLQDLMAYYVEINTWPAFGLGDTNTHTLDGFSVFTFLSHLAEDWVNEGRTSRSDSFTKLLLRTKYWGDDQALVVISKRAVNLSPDFSWETPKEIESLAEKFKEPSETPDAFNGRLDLQSMEAYTIDPPTAKDFDDAISIETHDNGSYTLWVHIADVANYVDLHSKLDMHAQRRSTSVYLPTATLPMLPNHLSDNLCSLREQVPRLAMSVEIKFDKTGRKINGSEKVHNTVILVNKNLTYDYVNEKIEKGGEPFVGFHKLSLLINKHRRSLNLETPEVRLELGKEMTISTKTSSASTKMIETYMVAANEAIGEIFARAKVPAIYRCHPLPEEERTIKFNGQAKILDLPYEIEYPNIWESSEDDVNGESFFDKLKDKGTMSTGAITFSIGGGSSFADLMGKDSNEEEDEEDLGSPIMKGIAQLSQENQEAILSPFKSILTSVEQMTQDLELQKLSYLLVLRMFPQALYTAGNLGHFGLGSVIYVHFTSPIRRFPDVIAHRICKWLIKQGRNDGNGDISTDYVYTAEDIEEMATHATEQSILAAQLERLVVSAGFSFLAKNQSFEQRLGIVSSISGGGVFVLLSNGIEARIPLSQMTSRPTFVDDHESMCFLGSRGKFDMQEELTPANYKDLLEHGDDPIEVLVKLGDKIAIEFAKLDHVEGKVEARPVKIYPRKAGDYPEGQSFEPVIETD